MCNVYTGSVNRCPAPVPAPVPVPVQWLTCGMCVCTWVFSLFSACFFFFSFSCTIKCMYVQTQWHFKVALQIPSSWPNHSKAIAFKCLFWLFYHEKMKINVRYHTVDIYYIMREKERKIKLSNIFQTHFQHNFLYQEQLPKNYFNKIVSVLVCFALFDFWKDNRINFEIKKLKKSLLITRNAKSNARYAMYLLIGR